MTAEPHENSDVAWARQWLINHSHGHLRIEHVQPITSRLAHLHRIAVVADDGQRMRYYLKRCEVERLRRWPEQLTHLAAVAAAMDRTAGILPYRIVAADATRGVLLTAEVPGRPLSVLHRPSIVWKTARRAACEGWRGAGRWLERLHATAVPSTASESRAAEIAGDIHTRLALWQAADPAYADLAAAARRATTDAVRLLAGRPVTVVLCHGDVTAGNIMVHGSSVGLVDLDDLRLDMPGVDWSQAQLAMDEFGHVGWAGTGAGVAEWSAAFAEGYGRPAPVGPEFWLPHLRNLAVYLLTLSRQRRGVNLARVALELRYRRLLGELRRTVSAVQREPASGRPDS